MRGRGVLLEGPYCPPLWSAMGAAMPPSSGAPPAFLGPPRSAGLKAHDPRSSPPSSGTARSGINCRRAPPVRLTKFKAVESVVSVLLDVVLHSQVGVQSHSQRLDRARRGENTFESVNGFEPFLQLRELVRFRKEEYFRLILV
ncbi:hypothetical protein NDU88_006181 [Pleurodeles waltl]|uniref:Uncharacterized protein n=1 Tax=Pleurodeles waltl TaxID=8319 RepID=A0AAV7LNE1_PLEWA|nr:hypothetical protein NDU88_006181 [Pleurodeles waltl]